MQEIYELIHPQLQAGKSVELDSTVVRRLLSVFFNKTEFRSQEPEFCN
ncbi:hypothetical protein [Nostoc sp.]|nr:hypothetical protein [Nostoc sp. NMS9]